MKIPRQIHTFIHCAKCAYADKPNLFEIGLTPEGLQIWCTVHNENVVIFTPQLLTEHLAKGCQCDCCNNKKDLSQ